MNALPQIDSDVRQWLVKRADGLVSSGMSKDQAIDCALQEISGRVFFFYAKDGNIYKARRFPRGFKKIACSNMGEIFNK